MKTIIMSNEQWINDWSFIASQVDADPDSIDRWLHSSMLIKISGLNACITNESIGDRMAEILTF